MQAAWPLRPWVGGRFRNRIVKVGDHPVILMQREPLKSFSALREKKNLKLKNYYLEV